jgi:hypothetical protein
MIMSTFSEPTTRMLPAAVAVTRGERLRMAIVVASKARVPIRWIGGLIGIAF